MGTDKRMPGRLSVYPLLLGTKGKGDSHAWL